MTDEIERLRLEIESKKNLAEIELKNKEIELREREIENARLRASNESRGLTTPVATALAAAATLIGGVLGAAINGYFSNRTGIGVESEKGLAAIELQKLKFQMGLVIKAIETRDQSQAVRTLQFFPKAGLIPNFKTDVLTLTERDDGREVPAIGRQFERPDDTVQHLAPYIASLYRDGGFTCTGLSIPNMVVLTADYCVDNDAKGMTVRFGSRVGPSFVITKALEIDKLLGIALLKYATTSGQDYSNNQAIAFRFRNPRQNEALKIFSYPDHQSLMISKRDCVVVDSERPI